MFWKWLCLVVSKPSILFDDFWKICGNFCKKKVFFKLQLTTVQGKPILATFSIGYLSKHILPTVLQLLQLTPPCCFLAFNFWHWDLAIQNPLNMSSTTVSAVYEKQVLFGARNEKKSYDDKKSSRGTVEWFTDSQMKKNVSIR